MSKVYFLFVPLLLAAVSCSEQIEYSKEPKICYHGFSCLFNENGTFTENGVLSITHVDGDLGLDASDTFSPFDIDDCCYNSFIVRYLKRVNGTFEGQPLLSWNDQVQTFDTVSFNVCFERPLDDDLEKPIFGQIDYTIPIQNPFSDGDSIKISDMIIDRVLNESNEVYTASVHTAPSYCNLNHYI
jgi:hypothetical protein